VSESRLVEALKAERAKVESLQAELMALQKNHVIAFPDRVGTVLYDLSPAMKESAIRDKLIELGWIPPAETKP